MGVQSSCWHQQRMARQACEYWVAESPRLPPPSLLARLRLPLRARISSSWGLRSQQWITCWRSGRSRRRGRRSSAPGRCGPSCDPLSLPLAQRISCLSAQCFKLDVQCTSKQHMRQHASGARHQPRSRAGWRVVAAAGLAGRAAPPCPAPSQGAVQAEAGSHLTSPHALHAANARGIEICRHCLQEGSQRKAEGSAHPPARATCHGTSTDWQAAVMCWLAPPPPPPAPGDGTDQQPA